MEPWKLSMKVFFGSRQESMEYVLRLSSQVSGVDSNAIEKYITLVVLEPPDTSMAVE
jgi:hypothetical protein